MQNSIVIPIAFNLVLIRTAQNRAEDDFTDSANEKVTTIAFKKKSMISADIQYSK